MIYKINNQIMLPKFHKLESNEHLKKNKINGMLTIFFYWFQKLLFSFIIIATFVMLIGSLFYLKMFYLIIISACCCYASVKIFYPILFEKYKFEKVTPAIHVNEKGFHKGYVSVFYDDLANNEDSGFGVHLKWIEKKQAHQLVVYLYQKNEKPTISYEIHSGLTNNKPSNKNEIIARFLLGVAHFRPYINVDPAIFEHYSIDNNTYKLK